LLREEIRLAQVEMTHKAKKAGSAAAMLAAGGFIAYAGFLFLLLALTFGLSYFMWDWLAALIVGGLVAVIGGFMVASNLDKLKQINPAPQQTIESLQEDKEWLKEQMK
jgi:fatty acid desaturase